jgi:hypothetical protein
MTANHPPKTKENGMTPQEAAATMPPFTAEEALLALALLAPAIARLEAQDARAKGSAGYGRTVRGGEPIKDRPAPPSET